ncbi:uncharacterized protein Z518_04506 [Rhinocladiella mackenziei CBS 650.93]|uniref:Major facilitator superfamily (MFS) profile domain-containing protein n=1 Tax=Rhinocladiella mackenziei CBS 650.93 TaxID=1442369 RepID=A0A0D2JBR3_9EURO|nr:uncharacterized protein Z518_04506 [Rhinocladiella mackenziei CBS 650.93]KIX06530.1 hypothetical protein Z518_04506 [Rhinocladiella mackenziei CBS 650.93]
MTFCQRPGKLIRQASSIQISTITTDTELHTILQSNRHVTSRSSSQHDPGRISSRPSHEIISIPESPPTNVATSVPEGGYGWTIVFICSVLTFWFNGISGSWGVVQAALLQSKLESTSTSTVSFIGTLAWLALWHSRRRLFCGKTGTRIVPCEAWGGIGAAVLSLTIDALINSVGIAWAFRILGFLILATCLPAAWFIQERVPIGQVPFVDLSMFRHLPLSAVFCAGAVGSFTLFVPPFFLPLVAQSIGLSSSTGAGLVAGFNSCTAVGRLLSGWLSDIFVPVNVFLASMILNAVSMLAIWPVSSSLGPLLIFAMLNGLADGAWFTLYPVVVTGTATGIGNGQGSGPAVAMSMVITGWTGGYLMGVPIAGYLLQASGVGVGSASAEHGQGKANFGTSIDPYRPAIFYAGGVALAAAGFTLIARLKMGQGGKKRV